MLSVYTSYSMCVGCVLHIVCRGNHGSNVPGTSSPCIGILPSLYPRTCIHTTFACTHLHIHLPHPHTPTTPSHTSHTLTHIPHPHTHPTHHTHLTHLPHPNTPTTHTPHTHTTVWHIVSTHTVLYCTYVRMYVCTREVGCVNAVFRPHAVSC